MPKVYAMVMIEVDKIEELHFKQISAEHSKLGFIVLSTFTEFAQDYDDTCETERWSFTDMQWHGVDNWTWRATYEEHGLSDETHEITGDVHGELPYEIGRALNAEHIEFQTEDDNTYILSYTRPWEYEVTLDPTQILAQAEAEANRAPQLITVELIRKEG